MREIIHAWRQCSIWGNSIERLKLFCGLLAKLMIVFCGVKSGEMMS